MKTVFEAKAYNVNTDGHRVVRGTREYLKALNLEPEEGDEGCEVPDSEIDGNGKHAPAS